ncbi:hypothetical protein ACFOQM_15045 [Paenibacillus sp. GCM10012307]|uniref:Uncharacterized protein n=1 Tax=Paenibacillus roseus TaxID=2798579 RepID=A0A934J960_9BACL|nr:hypothetical protein [Paenibacillus roseus]MBJ6362578.1 hypothetical protein [Paenibacillus roseus]
MFELMASIQYKLTRSDKVKVKVKLFYNAFSLTLLVVALMLTLVGSANAESLNNTEVSVDVEKSDDIEVSVDAENSDDTDVSVNAAKFYGWDVTVNGTHYGIIMDSGVLVTHSNYNNSVYNMDRSVSREWYYQSAGSVGGKITSSSNGLGAEISASSSWSSSSKVTIIDRFTPAIPGRHKFIAAYQIFSKYIHGTATFYVGWVATDSGGFDLFEPSYEAYYTDIVPL